MSREVEGIVFIKKHALIPSRRFRLKNSVTAYDILDITETAL